MVLGREGVVGSIGLVGLALVSIVDFPTQVYLSTDREGAKGRREGIPVGSALKPWTFTPVPRAASQRVTSRRLSSVFSAELSY